MQFRDLTINDIEYFTNTNKLSDNVFSYIFMYSDLYKLKIYNDDKVIIIFCEYQKPFFYIPEGDIEYGISKIFCFCKKNNIKPIISKIPLEYIDIYTKYKFKIKEVRSSFDYVFENSKLAAFEGSEFRKQRNNLSNYFKTCNPSYDEDIASYIDACKAFVNKYYDNYDIINPTIKLLDNFKYFDLKGGVILNEGKMQGFCIYEKIQEDTVLSHIELTDNTNRGIHAFMINEMSKRINEKYVNKEDDMGIAGLRRFKTSYNPAFMLKKHTACISACPEEISEE